MELSERILNDLRDVGYLTGEDGDPLTNTEEEKICAIIDRHLAASQWQARDVWDAAIKIVSEKWLSVSVGKVKPEHQSEYERNKVIAALEAARDAAQPVAGEDDK